MQYYGHKICLLHLIVENWIDEILGFDDYILLYATDRDQDILKRVNYALAVAGMREETGQQLALFLYVIFYAWF